VPSSGLGGSIPSKIAVEVFNALTAQPQSRGIPFEVNG